MQVEVIMAWPGAYQRKVLQMPERSTVADAVALAQLDGAAMVVAHAVHGVLAKPEQPLHEGDRVELLRPLLADPKENRRRRARGGD